MMAAAGAQSRADQQAEIEFGELTVKNVRQLQVLNEDVFPVKYGDKFYKDLVSSPEDTRLAYHCDVLVGAVSWRVEPRPADSAAKPVGTSSAAVQSGSRRRLYIMTLGVLGAYRGLGIGARLLECVLSYCKSAAAAGLDDVYLHVQTNNDDALAFYKRFGFEVVSTIEAYYKNIEPTNCFVLQKKLALE
eukprot:TRINITY_DN858_c0_g2_i1.p1 TRINITY_DN858_c0_g2~~TRINITY_DN858_c0_g2_i1.p1  ORF type:complete len:189 (-),score=73.37 TRINITY_DN858_c0_g2_i1:1160-1726(-)